MKKQWVKNVLIMISLGLSCFTLTYGRVQYLETNKYTGDWPIYTIYDDPVPDTNSEKVNKKDNQNTITINVKNTDELTQDENNTNNINTTSDEVSELTTNPIINDKNTIENLAFAEDFIKEINKIERNAEIAMLILILIYSVIFVIPFISPFVNKECKTKKNNTVNKNIIQSGLKPDIKEIATLVEKATLLKNDFKNIHDQVEINPTMFVKFDFLKTDFYEELSKIDWNKNQNKLLVEKYQLLVDHYAEEMNNELKKIEDEFAKAATENVNQILEKIEIIKNS
jgi:lipoprotein